MKKLLILALALTLPLAQDVRADNRKGKKQSPQVESDTAPRVRTAQRPAVQTSRRLPARNPLNPPRGISSASRASAPVQSANRSFGNRPNSNLARNGDRVTTTSKNRNNGAVVRHKNGSNRNFDRNSFNNARNRGVRTRHDRGWWRSHYNTTFVLFGGGYYYWDAGYWFPAYGYDPYYSNYAYDEPIYGYNNLAPGQVLENVQLALRDEGYYRGAIDGLIGPQTRAALAAFQRDNGLVETAAIDEPTLVTLGLA